MAMDDRNELLTTEQIAERYEKSLRWAQDLTAQNQALALKAGHESQWWSHDIDRVVQRSRPRGRPRRLATSDEIGLETANVAGAVQEAQTDEEIEGVLQEYLDWLELRRTTVETLTP